jgi:hypothetical protein
MWTIVEMFGLFAATLIIQATRDKKTEQVKLDKKLQPFD